MSDVRTTPVQVPIGNLTKSQIQLTNKIKLHKIANKVYDTVVIFCDNLLALPFYILKYFWNGFKNIRLPISLIKFILFEAINMTFFLIAFLIDFILPTAAIVIFGMVTVMAMLACI